MSEHNLTGVDLLGVTDECVSPAAHAPGPRLSILHGTVEYATPYSIPMCRYLRAECLMKVTPKRTTLLDRIAKWGQHGVRPELLVYMPQGGRPDKGAAVAAFHAHTQALSQVAKVIV